MGTDRLITRIGRVFSGAHTGPFDADALAAVSWRLGERLAEAVGADGARRGNDRPLSTFLRPSKLGQCVRKLALGAMGAVPEPIHYAARLRMAMGDCLESLIMIAGAKVGGMITDNNSEFPVKAGGMDLVGHADGVLVAGADRSLLEVKSMSRYGFAEFKRRGYDNTWGYLTQSALYIRALLELGKINQRAGVFLGICRDSLEMAEWEYQYDSAHAELGDMAAETVKAATETRKLPPIPIRVDALGRAVIAPAEPGGTLPLVCSYCDQKYSCYVKPLHKIGFESDGSPIYNEPITQHVVKRVGEKPVYTVEVKEQ